MACLLKTDKTGKPKVRFSKYEFNNKLLGDITLLRITSGVNEYAKVVSI